MLDFQNELAKKYKYSPLDRRFSKEIRQKYIKDLINTAIGPYIKNKENKLPLYSKNLIPIAKDFNKVVVGDYGAFIEIDEENIIKCNIKVQEGQEWRYEERYKNCKYYWLTDIGDSGIKIYHQKLPVKYANYKPNKYYISPYEVKSNFKNIAVVGSRDFNDYTIIKCWLLQYIYENCWNIPEGVTIVSGGARGVDTLAEQFAELYGCKKLVFPANWEKYGKSAGYLRNSEIIQNSDVVFAFQKNKSKGTQHSIDIARKLNKELYVFEV